MYQNQMEYNTLKYIKSSDTCIKIKWNTIHWNTLNQVIHVSKSNGIQYIKIH